MDNNKDHQLVLRVMRLTKPSFLPNLPILTEFCDLKSCYTKDYSIEESFDNSNILLLPQSFGSIFLGETFICYLSINNDSSNDATNINLKADLQNSTNKTILFNKVVKDKLSSGSSNDHIISHEVKELGIHILVCVVTYCNAANEVKLLRKFFKFEVLKPLDVKTKTYNVGSDKLFLETQIQNITKVPICMEKVNMEPSPLYTSQPLNTFSQNTVQNLSYLNPFDTRQYLYMLKLKPENMKHSLTERVAAIGKLDIVWKSNLGERGRLQTSQLQRAYTQHKDLVVEVLQVEGKCVEMEPLTVRCSLRNLSDVTKTVTLSFDSEQTNVMWLDVSGLQNEKVPPKELKEFSVSLLPVCAGIQALNGLLVTDLDLNRVHRFDDIHELSIAAKH